MPIRRFIFLLPLLPITAFAAPACPAAPQRWVERAIAADCLSCWQQADRTATRTLALDWIVPKGDDAELAVAALPEGSERFTGGTLPAKREQTLPISGGARLEVSSGLAWNGYVGLNFSLQWPRRGAWPADAVGYVALVERIPAGTDGSGAARQLVRALAGPLSLERPAGKAPLQHLLAVRLPANGDPARFAAVGWLETPDHRVLLAAQSPPAGCNTSTRR
jgi:hypothetical protein